MMAFHLAAFDEHASHFWHCSIFLISGHPGTLLDLRHVNKEGAPHVDLALRFEVLAAFAVFVFVGAVLLGAF